MSIVSNQESHFRENVGDLRPMGGRNPSKADPPCSTGVSIVLLKFKIIFNTFYPLIMGNYLERFKLCLKQRQCWELFALLFVQGPESMENIIGYWSRECSLENMVLLILLTAPFPEPSRAHTSPGMP